MKLITCSYCGTEYDKKQLRCPNCGTSADMDTGVAVRGSGRKQRDPDKIPGWLWACICGVLALAVLIGLIAFVIGMGYFEEGFDLNAIPTDRTQEEILQEQEVYPYEKPEEDAPEDLEMGVCRELQISQDEITLDKEGAKFFLSAATVPAYTTDELVYESLDETVATVGANGMITAVAPGETEILVTCGDVSEVCKVVCAFEVDPDGEEAPTEPDDTEDTEEPEDTDTAETEEEDPLPPTVTPDDFTLFYPGEEAQLTVKNVPDGASVSYVSSNAAVVTVSGTGKVTAVGNGQATITVMVGDEKLSVVARCNLNSTTEGGDVTTEMQAYTGPFALNYTDVTFQYQGEKLTLKLRDANGKEVTGLNWVSGNGSVCSVAGGVATAMGRGETKVSTTYNGTTYSCIVRTAF